MAPPISVVIPTKNEARYIGRTLRALEWQENPPSYEVVVADYRSKDRTREIARGLGARVVRVRQAGPGAGRNEGAAAARGEILVFLDADTIAGDNLLGEVARVFRQGRVVGATCPILPYSTDLEDFLLFWFINNYFSAAILAGVPHAAGICMVARAGAFEASGGFNAELHVAEDVDMAMRLRRYGRFTYLRKTLVVTDPRRVQRWGIARTASTWAANYVKVLTLGGNLARYMPGMTRYPEIR
ncbi:MAG: glycosyltransferase [Euryarchaeota archaeon]|nr:glycosyltransferase [Euryarchaeota archaeon]